MSMVNLHIDEAVAIPVKIYCEQTEIWLFFFVPRLSTFRMWTGKLFLIRAI